MKIFIITLLNSLLLHLGLRIVPLLCWGFLTNETIFNTSIVQYDTLNRRVRIYKLNFIENLNECHAKKFKNKKIKK